MGGAAGSSPPEYKEVVQAVVKALLQALADGRLPRLTPEEVYFWLSQLTLEEVREAYARVEASQNEFGDSGKVPAEPVLVRQAFQKAGEVVSEALQAQPSRGRMERSRCAGCGEPLPANAKFCSQCGRTVAGARHCLNCQSEISAEAKFCPSCGAKAA